MLRMIIVDDERIIRETIHNLIDWNKLNIEVVGLCKDGIEAYDMIIDEYPDIVLTDIKMPGLSGLELIQRISKSKLNIQFIILSGYGEFSFAKEAMKYGVKHYLLKPCNEGHIIEVINEAVEDCSKTKAFQELEERHKMISKNLHENIVRNIITENLSTTVSLSCLTGQYERFLDFTNTGYELCYLYYLQEQNLADCLTQIYEYNNKFAPNIPIYAVYVKNTLILFFENYHSDLTLFDSFIHNINLSNQEVAIEYSRIKQDNLFLLLDSLIQKLRRYETIYLLNGLHKIETSNHNTLLQSIENIASSLEHADVEENYILKNKLKELLLTVSDADFLKTLITDLLLKDAVTNSSYYKSSIYISEFLVHISQMADTKQIMNLFLDKMDSLFKTLVAPNKCKDFIEKTLCYVNENISDPNLSLKWISENYLYMNVDYVSKQFVKQTGTKFSTYLANARIDLAKRLLMERGTDKIYSIAEEIGCGNNPQYFSQLFKKHTGITPTTYVKNMTGN